MSGFINQPVRQLSLGQRMRGDIAAALLHSPKIVFFDEPTIGLDVVAKEKIRDFVKHLNKVENTTIIFTTHDMQDIEKVCERLIIIDTGHKVYDGTVKEIKDRYSSNKIIELELESDKNANFGKYQKYMKISDISEGGKIKKRIEFDINSCQFNEITEIIFSEYQIRDITVKEPELDAIIRDVYSFGENGIKLNSEGAV